MTHISNALYLSTARLSDQAGRLCYQTIATAATISATSYATSGAASFPPSNMANPATAFGWEAASNADQTIAVTNATGLEIDYVGLARHNLGQAGAEVRVRFDGVTVRDYAPVSSNQALLFLFSGAAPSLIQIDIRGASVAAKVAVLYVGKSIALQRNIYVGHTPIVYGRDRVTVNGVSQSGEYLGEVSTNETVSTTVDLQNLTPDWYRSTLDPFLAQRRPCFYAWRPGSYGAEVAYCWVEGNPRPVNQRANGMMSVSWNFRGIA